jgi:sortase A
MVTTDPLVIETPLPPADGPANETPAVLLLTVTPSIDPITPGSEQGGDQINPSVVAPTPAFGEIATRVVIPAIGLDTPIVLAPRQGDSWATDHLGLIVGQLEGTAPPGSAGNIVLGGHYTLPETNGGPGPFYNLRHLGPGDKVLLYQGEEEFEYVIDDFQTVDEKAIEITYSTGTPQLTLLTCTQWDRNQSRYVKRLIVTGHLV